MFTQMLSGREGRAESKGVRHSCNKNEAKIPKEQNLYVGSNSCYEENESELAINKLSRPTGDTCWEY